MGTYASYFLGTMRCTKGKFSLLLLSCAVCTLSWKQGEGTGSAPHPGPKGREGAFLHTAMLHEVGKWARESCPWKGRIECGDHVVSCILGCSRKEIRVRG